MERWRGWRAVPSRGSAVGQDTPHGLPATRCPPWPTHGCQGPQKSASVGKSLQDTAGPSPSTLGSERLPGAEQGQGLLSQFHGFGGKVDAWSCRDGSIPGVFYGCNPPGFPMLWERVNPWDCSAASPGELCWTRFSVCCSPAPCPSCRSPAGSAPSGFLPSSAGAPWGSDNPLSSPPPRWNAPDAGKGSVGFTAGKTPQIPSRG